MSEKNQSSPEVQNIIRDAKNLYGSIVKGIKKAIENYKTAAEKKKITTSEKPAAETKKPESTHAHHDEVSHHEPKSPVVDASASDESKSKMNDSEPK